MTLNDPVAGRHYALGNTAAFGTNCSIKFTEARPILPATKIYYV